jgi:hypothetical protein
MHNIYHPHSIISHLQLPIKTLAYSSISSTLYIASSDGSILLYKLTEEPFSISLLSTKKRLFTNAGKSSSIRQIGLLNANVMVILALDRVYLFDLESMTLKFSLPDTTASMFALTGDTHLCIAKGPKIALYSVTTTAFLETRVYSRQLIELRPVRCRVVC